MPNLEFQVQIGHRQYYVGGHATAQAFAAYWGGTVTPIDSPQNLKTGEIIAKPYNIFAAIWEIGKYRKP